MAICITWPSFTLTCHLLFIISTQKSIFHNIFINENYFGQFLSAQFLFWKNFPTKIWHLPFAVNLILNLSIINFTLVNFFRGLKHISRIKRLLCEISLRLIKTPSSLSMEVKDNKNLKHIVYTGNYDTKKSIANIFETQLSTTKSTNTNILILLSDFYMSKNIGIIATCVVLTTKRPLCLEKCIFPF